MQCRPSQSFILCIEVPFRLITHFLPRCMAAVLTRPAMPRAEKCMMTPLDPTYSSADSPHHPASPTEQQKPASRISTEQPEIGMCLRSQQAAFPLITPRQCIRLLPLLRYALPAECPLACAPEDKSAMLRLRPIWKG